MSNIRSQILKEAQRKQQEKMKQEAEDKGVSFEEVDPIASYHRHRYHMKQEAGVTGILVKWFLFFGGFIAIIMTIFSLILALL